MSVNINVRVSIHLRRGGNLKKPDFFKNIVIPISPETNLDEIESGSFQLNIGSRRVACLHDTANIIDWSKKCAQDKIWTFCVVIFGDAEEWARILTENGWVEN